jgi:glutamine---fructose-6-phosphate transaminase (isomerizing)
LHVDVLAGPERAVAATKSYTSELLALYLLTDFWRGGNADRAGELPGLAADVLDRAVGAELATRYRFVERLVVTARGYAYATAREAALKMMETSCLSAHAFSGADLTHGPLAMVDEDRPVIAIVSGGKEGAALAPVLEQLRERGADVLIVGDKRAAPWPRRRRRCPTPMSASRRCFRSCRSSSSRMPWRWRAVTTPTPHGD